MSQLVAGVINDAPFNIVITNTEDSAKVKTIPAQQTVVMDPPWNIPDMSDCNLYFEKHHMTIANTDGPMFYFWDDDNDHYRIKHCNADAGCDSARIMPGGNNGNNAKVMIHLMVTQYFALYAEFTP